MPIPHDASEEELEWLFSKINGLILPGGLWNVYEDMENEKYPQEFTKGARKLLELAIKSNIEGDYFPVHAIQNGLPLMCALLTEYQPNADGNGLFHHFDVPQFQSKLMFTFNATHSMWAD
jgi:gamma-glutamyl-gamma-aminobutyrate hydrolase PuuD